MEYTPPVVIEHVLPSDFDTAWMVRRLHFCREKESVGVDYDSRPGLLIGARYGDIAHIVGGPVRDGRWIVKITLRL